MEKITDYNTETIKNICKELNVSNATAQFLMNMPLEDLTSLSLESLNEQYEEYVQIESKL